MAPRAKSLSPYRAKRNFERTSEPAGTERIGRSERLRFVIQKHDATRLHYDLRLELDGVFKSWAVTKEPSLDPADKRLAVEVEDHPLAYGDFEGVIPKGEYGGGTVLLWDRGHWAPEGAVAPQEALAAGELKFTLDGARLKGSWVLVRMKRREKERRDNWLLIKHRENTALGVAQSTDDVSIASGRSMAEIALGKGPPPTPFMQPPPQTARKKRSARAAPDFVPPQLCRLLERAPSGAGWAHEIKFDGYRLQVRTEDGSARLRTRNGLDWTSRFPALALDAAALPDSLIDGELVAVGGDGAPDFSALQAAISAEKTDALVFFAFDLLFAEGEDLRHRPLSERKRRLEALLGAAKPTMLRYVSHLETSGPDILNAALRMGLEGIVSKRLDARYQSGRSETWVKVKGRPGQEIVIGGWLEENGRFRSLLAGAYDGPRLVYLGRVGSGFGAKTVEEVEAALRSVAAESSPFAANGPKAARGVHWTSPTLVAEVAFAGWTGDGRLRQAAFKGLRTDKDPKEVMVEKPEARPAPASIVRPSSTGPLVRGVRLTHPDKAFWPAHGEAGPVTKADLAAYLEAVSERMLAHIRARPCSITRAPDGVGGQQFFQRHVTNGSSPFFTSVDVSGEKEPYLQFDTPEALVAAAQIGALEFHPWNCHPNQPETPGRLVFDLDPAPDVPFNRVIEAAKALKDRLSHLGLESFCKTTGGKGLHVVTPLAKTRSAPSWAEAKAFAHEVCRQMAADSPELYLVNMAKKLRTGRIFLDYLRNDRTATAVAPYSPRARDGAPVSMPLTWAQVRPGLDPGRFTLRTVPQLTKTSKAWQDYDAAARPFAAAAKRLSR
jgi:bifunctional non-homologous end joining protein LigD